MEEIKIRELPEKSSADVSNYLIAEDEDGTKKVLIKHFKSLLIASIYFDSVEDLKNSISSSLKEGDICETLGYYTPGDGGGAEYRITYNPAAVEDGKLVHYLSYSDTLRAEIILGDTINVHQFGAVGDGITDDTDAIQGAIDNSDFRTIDFSFSNNKKYVTRSTININKTNTLINGNGAILMPHYVNGINIAPKSESTDMVTDVTINKLHVDCSRSENGIYIYKSSKVDIVSCKMSNISNKGINIKNSEFINISYCELDGEDTGSLLLLDGDNDTDISYSRFINVLDCKFDNFSKAVHLSTTGTDGKINTLINLDNCHYRSNVNNSCCVYIACPIEMVTMYANVATAANTFLYFGGAGKGDVTCRGLSCLNTEKVFDIQTTQGVLHLDGSIKAPDSVLFANMAGKLRSNITWELLPNGASFTNKPIGEIYDSINPYNYSDNRGYSFSGSKLTLEEARNLHINWSSSTNNINEIANGIKGQLLYIKSSTSKSIVAVANKIILSDSSIKLGPYTGILMRYDGSKWVQIQYTDSTIVETVSQELKIDYSEIEFDVTQIVTENE